MLLFPLCIVVGWGIIMYSLGLFGDALKLPWWACTALDALPGINIDLSVDTVAYRLHMWNWLGTGFNPLTAQRFGVPYGNFYGWPNVIFFYSYFSRLFEKLIAVKRKWLRCITVPLLALLCSEIVLYGTGVYMDDWLYNQFRIRSLHRLPAFLCVPVILIIFGWRKKQASRSVPFLSWVVPAYFHIFFFP